MNKIEPHGARMPLLETLVSVCMLQVEEDKRNVLAIIGPKNTSMITPTLNTCQFKSLQEQDGKFCFLGPYHDDQFMTHKIPHGCGLWIAFQQLNATLTRQH